MKKGYWNYTEPIEYRVIVVRPLQVPQTPLHWQNAFAGEYRQVVEVVHDGRSFFIDNADGSGLKKIAAGGGPDSMSRHIDAHEFIGLVPDDQAQEWSPYKCRLIDMQVEEWQQKNYPDEWKRLQVLKESFQPSGWKKRLDEMRAKESKFSKSPIPDNTPNVDKIRGNLLLLFEQSIGWKFRVKGTPLIDVVEGVDQKLQMVKGKQYGNFHIDLCELTNEDAPLSN